MVMEILHHSFMMIKFSYFSEVFFMESFTLFVNKVYLLKKPCEANLSVNFFSQLLVGTIFFNFLIIVTNKKIEIK